MAPRIVDSSAFTVMGCAVDWAAQAGAVKGRAHRRDRQGAGAAGRHRAAAAVGLPGRPRLPARAVHRLDAAARRPRRRGALHGRRDRRPADGHPRPALLGGDAGHRGRARWRRLRPSPGCRWARGSSTSRRSRRARPRSCCPGRRSARSSCPWAPWSSGSSGCPPTWPTTRRGCGSSSSGCPVTGARHPAPTSPPTRASSPRRPTRCRPRSTATGAVRRSTGGTPSSTRGSRRRPGCSPTPRRWSSSSTARCSTTSSTWSTR